ncbi:hypothetical protein SASPL_154937 [Salvia splendens]|uniref:Replication protein A subunit n=1 Tax=Salvia splendens TaxID=180675 RepID=A0A8X8YZ60_SALSN|nr:hypothetical protein SASPL_154937 [Salvia splendens]
MAKTVSPNSVSVILANPCPDSSSDFPEIVVQVLDLKATGNNTYLSQQFMASDGKMKEVMAKSAAQIVPDQRGNMAPAARMSMTRRVHPLASLNPYQGNWTIKVRGLQGRETCGLTGMLGEKAAEEDNNEATFLPETKFSFTPIDELGPYVNGRELVDVIGVVQSVSPTVSIRRKSNNETIPKRDIVIADETYAPIIKKTVVVSLWNDLATSFGQELLDMANKSPVVAMKSLKVGEFQGVSLSALSKSIMVVDPDMPEAKKLRFWYDSEGKDTSLAAIGQSPSNRNGARSMYSDRVSLSHITSNPSLGEDKPAYFSIKAYISAIKPDQAMWYRACKTCSKKVTEAVGSGYWCEGCQKNEDVCSLRYIMAVKVSDASGEAFISDGEASYQKKLKEATWVPHLFRVSVTTNEYNNEKRQRITARAVAPIDYATESKYLVEDMTKIKLSKNLLN